VAILVTGAGGLIGRAAVAALLRQGVEHVRAVVREPGQVGDLRRLGAKVAVMDAADPDGLAAAMAGVFTACSLTGSLWGRRPADPYAAVVQPAEVFLAAAEAAGVRRVIVCSPAVLGRAAPTNPHLAAKAQVERMVVGSGLEHAILRCTHVLGPGSRLLDLLGDGRFPVAPPGTGGDRGRFPDARPGAGGGGPFPGARPGEASEGGRGSAGPVAAGQGEPVPVPGDGRQRVAPVWVGDVAAAIAAADDAVELAATWSLAGPTELTLDALVDTLHGHPAPKRHLPPAGGMGGGARVAPEPGTSGASGDPYDSGRPGAPGDPHDPAASGAPGGPGARLTPVQLEVLAADSLPDPALPLPPGPPPIPLAETLARSTGRQGPDRG
jgi:uncharacterized protein YbjT (DUF2867 family)